MRLSRLSLLCNTHVQTSLTEEQLKSGEMNQMLKEGGGGVEREREKERQPVYVPLGRMQNVHVLLVFYDLMSVHALTRARTHQYA